MDNHGGGGGGGGEGFMFPSEFPSSSAVAWPLSSTMISPMSNPMVPVDTAFLSSSFPHHPSSIHGDHFYSRRASSAAAMQLSDHFGGVQYSDHLGIGGLYMPPPPGPVPSPFASLHAELISKMTAQEIMDAKALAASKSHSEAERRRRERINSHLAKLRSLLPSTTKTDKASLLAEVIQHVKELKRQTSEMAEEINPLPTEADELTLDTANENGRFIIKASLCCDDRSDLIPDLANALKSLRLRTLKAEITTLGGRVKNILVVTGEDDDNDPDQHQQSIVSSIQDAFRAVMERAAAAPDTLQSAAGGGIKRQRTNNLSTVVQQRSSF